MTGAGSLSHEPASKQSKPLYAVSHPARWRYGTILTNHTGRENDRPLTPPHTPHSRLPGITCSLGLATAGYHPELDPPET